MFLPHAAANQRNLRDQIQSLFHTSDQTVQQAILAKVGLELAAFAPQTSHPASHPAKQLANALLGLLRKLAEEPKRITPSVCDTANSALELLAELCAGEPLPEFISHPPIQTLVVDDDPISRRAAVFALQTAFEKPGSVGSGEAAVVAATEQAFDVIFLDVLMPGMDGFTACEKIRKTPRNAQTPVVFVTSLSSAEVETKLRQCGGNDFVGKPFLKAEIIVKALVHGLRSRLQKHSLASPARPAPQKVAAKPTPDHRRKRKSGHARQPVC